MLLTIHSGTLTKSHPTDAGFDVHSAEDVIIPPFDKASISTGLNITLPPQTLALGKPRSGTSFKNDIETGAGVIDNDYSGEVRIKLYNFGDKPFHIIKGQRIAQLVILHRPDITVKTLNDSKYYPPKNVQRGTKGFGSTDQTEDTKNQDQLDSSSFNINTDLLDYVPEQAG